MIAVIGLTKVNIGMKMRLPEPCEEENFTKTFEEITAEQEKPDDDGITAENCGCGFNVAKQLAGWGLDVTLLSVVGNDILGKAALGELKECGVNTDRVKVCGGTTPISVQQYNILGDVETDRSNDMLTAEITPEMIDENADLLNSAEVVFADGSLPRITLEHIAANYGSGKGIKLFFDPAGIKGAVKTRKLPGGFYCVLPGRTEAENMSGLTILSEDELHEAGGYFADKGVSLAVITMKGGGLYYRSDSEEGIIKPERIISFAKTTGAGDVVSAAVVYAETLGKTAAEAGSFAMEKAAEFLAGVEDKKYIDAAQ